MPYVKTGKIDYYIPVDGAVAMWFRDNIELPPIPGKHYNWDISVDILMKIAEVVSTPKIPFSIC